MVDERGGRAGETARASRDLIVLGIDAAWTATQPSGIALLRRERARWRCLAVAPSYDGFVHGFAWRDKPRAATADCDAVLATCVKLAGALPDVIAIDMPLARTPIVARRAADNAISSAFGRFGLGAHSPNAARPGPIAEQMRRGFEAHGYALATRERSARAMPTRVMIEVFPHAALVALLDADYRVPYKLSRAAQYWPERAPAQRKRAIVARWRRVRTALAAHVDGVATLPLRAAKRYEDALDALVCAWVGIEFLAGRARPHGDDSAAVWATPVVKRQP